MPLGSVIFITVFVMIFGAFLLFLASKLKGGTGGHQDDVKLDTYECGLPILEKKETRISVKFYLTAILFIIFDIEIIFMYPWAITYKDFIQSGSGLGVLVAMGIFLLIFIFGLFWEVKSKALEWE